MSELVFKLDNINPVDFFGINNAKFKIIQNHFSKLKIFSRGNKIVAAGNEEELEELDKKINHIFEILRKNGKVSEQFVTELLLENPQTVFTPGEKLPDNVIVYGNGGTVVKAKTPNQEKLVQLSEKNDIVFAVGPAGTGKTYTAVALAVRALKNKWVKKIILTRPAVEAGENLGFLPGDLKEKVDPYLRPLYDALDDMLPPEKLSYYMSTRVIEVAPLAFMRGRTLDKAFMILDEAQNASLGQLKMFLTRIGPSAKCIITGDLSQIDLPKNQQSGLAEIMHILKDIDGIGKITLDQRDVIRHRLVKDIIQAFDKYHPEEKEEKNPSGRKNFNRKS